MSRSVQRLRATLYAASMSKSTRPDLTEPLDPVLDFMRLLWAIEHRLERTSKRMAIRVGVTGPQRFVLRIVDRFPGISAGELAHIVELHPSTLTGILRRLQQKGLLVREVDARDSRRALFRIRDRARGLTTTAAGTVEAAVRHVLRVLPGPRVDHARAVLAALASALDAQSRRSAV
jgi:DNA-binding MarR family transcriptional regulator